MAVKPKLLKGSIIVTSPSGRDVENVSIEISDKVSGIIIADIKMTFEQFGMMLARPANTDCEIRLFQSENIGKRMEVKRECVKLQASYGEEFQSDFHKAVEPLEVDGWKADGEMSWNHHRSQDGKYLATFRRWVDEKEGDEA